MLWLGFIKIDKIMMTLIYFFCLIFLSSCWIILYRLLLNILVNDLV